MFSRLKPETPIDDRLRIEALELYEQGWISANQLGNYSILGLASPSKNCKDEIQTRIELRKKWALK